MKRLRSFLYLLGLALAFAAGYKLSDTHKHKPLQVLYWGDAALATTPPEQQVLALILADPCHDAQMAVWAKDFRRVSTTGPSQDSALTPEEVKILPFSSCCIWSFSQMQVRGIVENYVKAYNDSLTMLLSKRPAADPAQKADLPP